MQSDAKFFIMVSVYKTACGNGQEMVIFVTGLKRILASAAFLNQFECGRYYQYNKGMLFEEQEAQMKGALR